MTKTRSTKHALLMSALALLLCVSMFVGSTFAWFTESIKSGRNIIQSGNLDVKLSYSTWDAANNKWSDYAEVTKTTKVFKENALFEPGYTEVVKFKVENLGSLALKYNLTAMVYSELEGTNVDNKQFKLSDYIYVGIIDGANTALTREAAADAATVKLGTGFGLMKDQMLDVKDAADETKGVDEFVLVLSMPETVGNEANHKTSDDIFDPDKYQPKIELGVALVATQYVKESDSFDNQYDIDADYLNLPRAKIKTHGPSDISGNMIDANQIAFGNSFSLPDPLVLDASYTFIAPDTASPEYADYRVDYVVSIDTDIQKDQLVLAGQYDAAFGDTWVAFSNPIAITAGQEVPLLASFYGEEHDFTYQVICDTVKEFQCGVANISVPRGAKMTVALRIFETDASGKNTGVSYDIAVVEHVFTGPMTIYASSAADLLSAQEGDTIKLSNDITLSEAVTLPANTVLYGNGHQINGTISAGGDLTIADHVKVTGFSASYYNRTITIGEGACLELTGSGRMSVAYGNTFNITGTLTDAKTTDKTTVQPSLIVPGGISITGGNDATVNIKNAYVQIGSTSSKNSAANGTFNLNFTNSIVEFTSQFTLSEPTSGMNPTFNVNVKDSVLITATKFIVAAPNSNVVIDNSTVTIATYFRNSGNVLLKNGSTLTGATIQFGENGGNDGITTVDASSFKITATSEGHALDGKGTGKLILQNGATASVDYYKALTVEADATSTMTGTDVTP